MYLETENSTDNVGAFFQTCKVETFLFYLIFLSEALQMVFLILPVFWYSNGPDIAQDVKIAADTFNCFFLWFLVSLQQLEFSIQIKKIAIFRFTSYWLKSLINFSTIQLFTIIKITDFTPKKPSIFDPKILKHRKDSSHQIIIEIIN
jgi:hypothetical protein